MTYLEIKKLFVEMTGRYDLVVDTTSYADQSVLNVKFFINAGARLLDSLSNRKKELLWYNQDLSAGDSVHEIDNLRSIKEVWVENSSGRNILTKKSLGWIRDEYEAASTQGTPLYWAPGVKALSPQQSALTSADYTTEFTYNATGLMFGNHFNKMAVIIHPVLDSAYTLSVLGMFFEKTLSDDSDLNYWSEVYPEALLNAGMYAIESFYSNREGMRDHLESIQRTIRGIEFDTVDEEISGETQVRG